MAEIPEHLLKRAAAARKKAEGGEEESRSPSRECRASRSRRSSRQLNQLVQIQTSLLKMSMVVCLRICLSVHGFVIKYLAGEDVGAAAGGAAPAAAAVAPGTPEGTGPGGHTQRLLTVVKAGSIQQTRAEAQDKVHTWPHLLVVGVRCSFVPACSL